MRGQGPTALKAGRDGGAGRIRLVRITHQPRSGTLSPQVDRAQPVRHPHPLFRHRALRQHQSRPGSSNDQQAAVRACRRLQALGEACSRMG